MGIVVINGKDVPMRDECINEVGQVDEDQHSRHAQTEVFVADRSDLGA